MSSPIIYTVSPRTSKITVVPLITVTGYNFYEDGMTTTVLFNNEPIEPVSITDTQIAFIHDRNLAAGIYTLKILKSDGTTTESATTSIIKYKTTYPIKSTSDTKCFVKPKINLVYAGVGELDKTYGKYVTRYRNTSDTDTEYVHVQLMWNENIDIATGGLDIIPEHELLEGDIIYLTNQTETSENGLYTASESAWTFYSAITENIFIDLGATSYDEIDGDISRNIVIDQYILFSINDVYNITYYSLNSLGVLSTAIRKVSIIENDSSIPIINHKITDYSISDNVPKELFQAACGVNGFPFPPPNPAQKIKYIKQDGSVIFIKDQSMGNNKLIDIKDPENDNDAVNLKTLQAYSSNYNGSYYTIGERIEKQQLVYIGSDGLVYVAKITGDNIDDYMKYVMGHVIGIATETKENSEQIINNEIFIASRGILDGFSDLTTGLTYYLNSTTGFKIGTPNYTYIKGFIQIIGTAISSTSLNIQIMTPIGI